MVRTCLFPKCSNGCQGHVLSKPVPGPMLGVSAVGRYGEEGNPQQTISPVIYEGLYTVAFTEIAYYRS